MINQSYKILIGPLLGLLFAASFATGADAPATSPSTQPEADAMVYSVADHDVLISMNNQQVIVEGIVSEMYDASPRVLLIRFKDNDSNGFVGVTFKNETPVAHDQLDGAVGKALIGKTVHMKGQIVLYRGNPEMEVTDMKQIDVVDTPATVPSAGNGH